MSKNCKFRIRNSKSFHLKAYKRTSKAMFHLKQSSRLPMTFQHSFEVRSIDKAKRVITQTDNLKLTSICRLKGHPSGIQVCSLPTRRADDSNHERKSQNVLPLNLWIVRLTRYSQNMVWHSRLLFLDGWIAWNDKQFVFGGYGSAENERKFMQIASTLTGNKISNFYIDFPELFCPPFKFVYSTAVI